jgi:CBS domain-containing protein
VRVRDVMASPVVTVAPDAALKEVASLLVERRINAVPVVDAGDRLIGIVSEADLLSLETGQAAGGAPPHSVGEVMRKSVYTLTGDTEATAAARLMLRHRLKSVPVVDGDRVVGMVTRRDLLRLIARSDDDIRADLERRVAEELEALRQAVIEVRDGVVTVEADGPRRQLVEQLARTVPGVVEVRSRRPDPAP